MPVEIAARVSRVKPSPTDAVTGRVARLKAEGTHRWSLQVAGLEEAFIYLMAGARDNFAGDSDLKIAGDAGRGAAA